MAQKLDIENILLSLGLLVLEEKSRQVSRTSILEGSVPQP